MKRMSVMLAIVFSMFAFTHIVHAQAGSVLHVNAGYLNPNDSKGGMLIGVMLGKEIDDAVDVAFGVDFMHKTYSDQTPVATEEAAGTTIQTEEKLVDYTRTILPLKIALNVKIPAGRYFGYYINGSLSYQFLFSKEKNYDLETSESRTYKGLGWQAAGGIFYHVGSRSTLTTEVFYNSCEVTRDLEKSTKGLPVSERIDLSGLGFRLGVILDIR